MADKVVLERLATGYHYADDNADIKVYRSARTQQYQVTIYRKDKGLQFQAPLEFQDFPEEHQPKMAYEEFCVRVRNHWERAGKPEGIDIDLARLLKD